jgi:rhamnosyltransferase
MAPSLFAHRPATAMSARKRANSQATRRAVPAGTVIVLGMHRSGTSVVAGLVRGMGVHFGSDLLGANWGNPTGHHEDLRFIALNERILEAAGGSWSQPPARWKILLKGRRFSREIRSLVNTDVGPHDLWGWKDPRTVLTFDLFRPHLRRPHLLVVRRDHHEVARSLHERDASNLLDNLALAHKYARKIDSILSRYDLPRLELDYHDLRSNPESQIRRIAEFLGKDLRAEEVSRLAETVLDDDSLRTARSEFVEAVSSAIGDARRQDGGKASPRTGEANKEVGPDKVCAVVVTYEPDEGLAHRLAVINAQVDILIVVDNNSHADKVEVLQALQGELRLDLILNSKNLGLAAALNQGLGRARSLGYEWSVTFDQDSLPAPDMIERQLLTLNSYHSSDKVLFVSPNIYSAGAQDDRPWGWLLDGSSKYRFRIVRTSEFDLEDVTLTITSGALTNLSIFEKLGPFREEYFIDYVDTEYCLRGRSRGFTILVSAKARLDQRLGSAREFRLFGKWITPTFHSPLRRYYIQRNRIPTMLRFGRAFPHWLVFDLVVNGLHQVLILIYEDFKLQKFWALLWGTWDGLTGRMGHRQPRRSQKSPG